MLMEYLLVEHHLMYNQELPQQHLFVILHPFDHNIHLNNFVSTQQYQKLVDLLYLFYPLNYLKEMANSQ